MVDISRLEEIFAKKSEGQELSIEDEELLDRVNFEENGKLSSKDMEDIKNAMLDVINETSAESIEKATDVLTEENMFSGIALVCTKVLNGVPILYEFKSVANARLIAKKIMQESA